MFTVWVIHQQQWQWLKAEYVQYMDCRVVHFFVIWNSSLLIFIDVKYCGVDDEV